MRINTSNSSPEVSVLFCQMKTDASSSIAVLSSVETLEPQAKLLCDGISEAFKFVAYR